MKKLLILSLVTLSSVSFAGTCFRATNPVSEESKLPSQICIESYELKLIVPELPELPSYTATVVTDIGTLKKSKLNFRRGITESFDVQVTQDQVYVDYGTCSGHYHSFIQVTFKVDSKGTTIDNTLGLLGVEIKNNDECHSSDTSTITHYEAI